MEAVGDCRYDPCPGCTLAPLPEKIRRAAARAVDSILEEQEKLAGSRGGQLPKAEITALSRKAVRSLANVESSTAAVSAVEMKNEGKCLIPE